MHQERGGNMSVVSSVFFNNSAGSSNVQDGEDACHDTAYIIARFGQRDCG